jgi:ABC-2 type transport system permease protein
MDENYYPIMPISLGLTVGSSSAEVTELLVTSEDSFSKLDGYSLSTYDKEDGDIDGSFAVAVSVETDNEGQIIWFASSDFLDDMYNAYSSGANDDLAMNALSALIGEREALAIRSKSLNYNYLTISDAEGSVLKVWMIGILPLMYLGVGIFVTVYTRSKQNEAI